MAVEWIAFHLTDRCQLDCQHCLRDPEKKPKDLPLDLIRRVLVEARQVYQAEHAAFTGGEPMLHPEFSELLDVAVDLNFTWHMVSNAKRFPALLKLFRQRPSRREKMTSITFSLDGASEETHDAIRGTGNYREVMSAVSLCTALSIPFVFNVTLHARNVHELESVGLLASQLGAARVSFVQMQPTGTEYDAGFFLSAKAWQGVMDRIDRLAEALKLPIGIAEGFYRKQRLHICQAFASQQLHIDVEGRLNLCCQHSGIPSQGRKTDSAGSLHQMTLAEAHRRLLAIIHAEQAEKVARMSALELDTEWDQFPCNYCLKSFGKPHWTENGAAGPNAERQRWHGAWESHNPRHLPLFSRPLS